MSYIAIGGAAVSIVGGIMGGSSAAAAQRAAAARAAALNAQLDSLEKNRQAIINPYAATKNLSSMAKDLSGNIQNQFANLGVATQAAKFQAEEADIALANTLDTLRETGSSAGGATALAQAALQSKRGISANIEAQEAQNEKLRAQGAQEIDKLKMAESQRIQSFQISEAQKMQDAENAGNLFRYSEQEKRDMQKMNRIQAQLTGAQNQEAAAAAAGQMSMANMFSGIGSAVTTGLGALSAQGNANVAGGLMRDGSIRPTTTPTSAPAAATTTATSGAGFQWPGGSFIPAHN
jgi:hypothetical protein